MSMTALSPATLPADPLDIMEQIVIANDWAFDRRSDSGDGRRSPRPLVRLRTNSSPGRTK